MELTLYTPTLSTKVSWQDNSSAHSHFSLYFKPLTIVSGVMNNSNGNVKKANKETVKYNPYLHHNGYFFFNIEMGSEKFQHVLLHHLWKSR